MKKLLYIPDGRYISEFSDGMEVLTYNYDLLIQVLHHEEPLYSIKNIIDPENNVFGNSFLNATNFQKQVFTSMIL